MNRPRAPRSATAIALIGLAALASAMGVGRFAFTPLYPLMQAEGGLSLQEGAWLAGVNYAGYLAGALACSSLWPASRRAAALGLAAVAITTVGMGLTGSLAAWFALRFIAGVASAYVLVGVSAWALPALALRRRTAALGWVFAGVGVGVLVAGVIGLETALAGRGSAAAWIVLGAASTLAALAAWPVLGRRDRSEPALESDASSPPEPRATRAALRGDRIGARGWRLVLCYGAYGFGYIIPATFLPILARELIPDPAIFGWIWPAFGATAAISTALVSRFFARVPVRQIWAWAHIVMAVGVVAPLIHPSLAALLVAAICVGGTFVVITLVAMQVARQSHGDRASRLMAMMTAAFALGQLAGPILVGTGATGGAIDIAAPSLLAAGLLVASAWLLFRPDRPRAVLNSEHERVG